MTWRRAIMTLTVGFALVSSAACGDDSAASASAGKCPADNAECKEIATVEAGKTAITKRKCATCHGDDMSGSATPIAGSRRPPSVRPWSSIRRT